MKSIGVNEHIHERIKKLQSATGIVIYRLIEEALDYLEDKYKHQLEKLNGRTTTN